MLVRARGGYRPGSSTGAFAYCGTTRACETLPLVQLLLHGVLHCGARWRVSTPSSRQSKRQSSNQPQRRVVCSRAPRTDYRKPPLRASSTSNGPGRKQVVYAARTVRDGTITRWRIRHGPCGTVHTAYGTRCMRHGERGTAHAAQCMRDGARGAVYKARCIRLGPCGTAHPTRCKRHGASGTVYAARCIRHGACSTVHAARRTRDGACGTVHAAQCS